MSSLLKDLKALSTPIDHSIVKLRDIAQAFRVTKGARNSKKCSQCHQEGHMRPKCPEINGKMKRDQKTNNPSLSGEVSF